MKNKIDKKYILLVIFFVLLIVFILTRIFIGNKISKTGYRKYVLEMNITAKDMDGNDSRHNISFYTDGKNSKLNTKDLEKEIYFSKNTGFYEESGKFKTFDLNNSYKNIYKSLSKIKLDKPVATNNEKKDYSVVLSKDVINRVLNDMFLGKNTTKDTSAYITLNNQKISNFVIHLDDIEGYQNVAISLTFKKLDKDFTIAVPKSYKELVEKIDSDFLKILQ